MIKDLKKQQKEINSIVRKFNKKLAEDCFAGRFYLRQVDRRDLAHCDEPHVFYEMYVCFELCDREEPERNRKTAWLSIYSIRDLYIEMNDFIVNSDFWELWDNFNYRRTHWYSGAELQKMVEFDKRYAAPFEREV